MPNRTNQEESTMTSESYSKMVEDIELQIAKVKTSDELDTKKRLAELKKEKRALKNKASAMRCREKKRRRMESLEKTVEELNIKLARLEEENRALRLATGNSSVHLETKGTSTARTQTMEKRATAPIDPINIISNSTNSIEHSTQPPKKRMLIQNEQPLTLMPRSRTHAVTSSASKDAGVTDFSDLFDDGSDTFGEDDSFLSLWNTHDNFLGMEQSHLKSIEVDLLDEVEAFLGSEMLPQQHRSNSHPRTLVGVL